mmetsp:Transcript_23340/g.70023  ORF Transcript_23340/g.70023 Transcript_23340/m.70023 type:complete len:84 (+) Transcript_23340:104-355(+)
MLSHPARATLIVAGAITAAHAFATTRGGVVHQRCGVATRALGNDVFPSTATDVFVGNLPYERPGYESKRAAAPRRPRGAAPRR